MTRLSWQRGLIKILSAPKPLRGWMQDEHPRQMEQPAAQELWRLLGSKAVNTIQESFLLPSKETPSSNTEKEMKLFKTLKKSANGQKKTIKFGTRRVSSSRIP